MDCSLPGCSIHGIFQARVLDWGAIAFSESEEELKSLLMNVKEESEKAGSKLNIQKANIMASSPIISWRINGETTETGNNGNSDRLYFLGLQNHCGW